MVTLAQAAWGVTFVYRARIERDLPGVRSAPLDDGGCDQPGPSGLAVLEMVTGYGQLYCICDRGLCPSRDSRVDLQAGVYEGRFTWDGRAWHGPSDTGTPKGDPFPPGTYRFRVSASGDYRDAGGADVHWEAVGDVAVHLVP